MGECEWLRPGGRVGRCYDEPMFGFLGPLGTFTHQALLTLPQAHGEELVPYPSVSLALDAVRDGKVQASLVPIENSVEGGVSATLDNLARVGEDAVPLSIIAEVTLSVQFQLMVRPNTEFEQITRVLTHPHASAQCREWLAATMPEVEVVEGGSTAAAAKEVSRPDSAYDAAICAEIAGEMYGLETIRADIADNTTAVTRFVLVSPQGRTVTPAPTGADKTTFVAYMHRDRAGALMEILEQLASRGVNLCRIESRPTKQALGSYCFSIDAEGHVMDERVGDALMGLRRICQRVVFLGSYPRADAVPAAVPFGGSNGEYRSAKLWLDDIRNLVIKS